MVPSLPGYGYAEPREGHGGLFGFGDLWHKLMTEELGYERFGAHGGDWGSTVTEHLARSHASSVIGIHLTDVPFWHAFQKPKDLSVAERALLDQIEEWMKTGGAYATIQGTRPRTAAVGLNDSLTSSAGARCRRAATSPRLNSRNCLSRTLPSSSVPCGPQPSSARRAALSQGVPANRPGRSHRPC